MKCPLSFRVRHYPDAGVILEGADCLKEECAWWDNQDKRCVLATIAGCLKTHLGWIGDLVDKIDRKGG